MSNQLSSSAPTLGNVRQGNTKRKAKVTVTVVEARDLIPMDRNGLSDPFVVIIYNQDSKTRNTTKIQYQTLNPSWNETFEFTSTDPFMDKLKFVVWDYDRFKNDFEGQFSLPMMAITSIASANSASVPSPTGPVVIDEWFPLRDRNSVLKKSKGTEPQRDRGELHLIIKYEPLDVVYPPQSTNSGHKGTVSTPLPPPPVSAIPPPSLMSSSSSSSAPSSVDELTTAIAETRLRSSTKDLEEHFTIDYSEIEMEKELGRGAFGVVYKGKWRLQDVAIKVTLNQNMSPQEIADFKAECQLMMNLRPHRNVVPLLGVSLNPQSMFCLVTDFVEGGSLESLIQGPYAISWPTAIGIAKGIVAGVYHLHKEHILHRDLAARNILLRSNYDALIADFGLSKRVEIQHALDDQQLHTQEATALRGPYKWMAPESLSRNEFTVKTDAYSFGVVLFEIVSREAPYPHLDIYQAAKAVVEDGLRPPIPQHTPAKIAELMKSCWETDPNKRPDFKNISDKLKEIEAEIYSAQ